MQTIPLIYSVIEDLKLQAGKPYFKEGKLSVEGTVRAVSLECLKSKKERGKVLVADIVGLNHHAFNANFIEFCKAPGNELWLIEPIYDDADVLDAFLGSADKIVFPYSDIRNDSVLKDILEISDNCIPLIVCRQGRYEGKDPIAVVRKLSETGFHNIMVADIDGSLGDAMWDLLLDECGGLISYSPLRKIEGDCHILAEDVFPFSNE